MDEPAALIQRPRWGLLPIPFVTYVAPDGKPDFRTHDQYRRLDCAMNGLCQLCGTPLEGVAVFAGQRSSGARLTFGEPPMHEDCAEFAWTVCPWLAGGTWRPPGADDPIEYVQPIPEEGSELWMVWAKDWKVLGAPRLGFYTYRLTGPVLWAECRRRGVASAP